MRDRSPSLSIGKPGEQDVPDHQVQDRIPEELQAFVVPQAGLGGLVDVRAVPQGLLEQASVGKRVFQLRFNRRCRCRIHRGLGDLRRDRRLLGLPAQGRVDC